MTSEEIERQIEILWQLNTFNRKIYVAAACDAGPCKIGYSVCPESRVRTLRSEFKVPDLQVRFAVSHDDASVVEWSAHLALRGFRCLSMPGREWFSVDVETAVSAVSEAAKKTKSQKDSWRNNPKRIRRFFEAHQKYPARTTPEAMLSYRFEA
jgi:hypothetical protein